MPSIVIREIDETSAGSTAIVNDVAYVPGFSTKVSTVDGEAVKFVKDEDPSAFIPYLKFIDGTPPDGSTISVVGKNGDTDVTCTFSGDGVTTEFEFPSDKIMTTVTSVTVDGVVYSLWLAGKDKPTTADSIVMFGSVGDFFLNTTTESLFEASNVLPESDTITFTAEITVTPTGTTTHTATYTLGSAVSDVISVTSVSGGAVSDFTYNPEAHLLTMTFSSNTEKTVLITGELTGDGKSASLSIGVSSIESATYNGIAIKDYCSITTTDNENFISFTYVFWNIVDNTDGRYTIVIVPENVPTYCSTKRQFESLFGAFPYKFVSNQKYEGFAGVATPNAPMFRRGDYDPSYVYAKELICAGVPVYYDNVVKRDESGLKLTQKVADIYDRLKSSYDELSDPNEYNVKYITSGGYPTFEYGVGDNDSIGLGLVNQALKIATQGVVDDTGSDDNAGRGDIVALIDHTNNPNRPFTGQSSVSYKLGIVGANSEVAYTEGTAAKVWHDLQGEVDPSYGAMFTPWFKYTTVYTDGTDSNGNNIGKFVIKMPGSFAYLMDLASSIKTNPSWFAIAGVNRAQVINYTGRTTSEVLTAKIAQNFQLRKDLSSINPITEIRPYGQCVWGNRTLKAHEDGLTATTFLNIRNLVCDVKKTVYRAAKRCMFEQDTQVLWINFKSQITPLLDQMATGQGIKAYKIVRIPTTEKGKFEAKVILYPIYAVEDIEVTVVMRDEEVSVTSNEQ